MNYQLCAKILRKKCSEDVKKLIQLYTHECDLKIILMEAFGELKDEISILKSENKILKEEANQHGQ